MINKDKFYEGTVSDLTVNGDGIVKIDSYPVFVKGAVTGDTIRFKLTKTNKTYGFGELNKIIIPSPDRRTPLCSSFCDCGGCSLMHISYDAQLKFKSDFVRSNIIRIGGYADDEFEYESIIGADDEYNYRNKAQFPVGKVNGKTVCGFYVPKSHTISPCETCYIQDERINTAVGYVMSYIRANNLSAYNESNHKGIVRHIYVRIGDDEIMVVIVTNSSKKLKNTEPLVYKLSSLGKVSLIQNVNMKKTNVILGEKNIVLYGKEYIHINIDGLIFKVSPHSFFQVNTNQMKKLYSKALEYADVSKDDTVFDLYCGVGSISLCLAQAAKKVIGVEIVPDAIENAKENAALSNVDNAEFYCGDCTEVVEDLLSRGEKADVVVVDPPRKGCDEKLFELVETISPKKLIYVSCNSATLARDLAILKEKGYILKKACAVDMFPQTGHVESVALIVRTDSATKFA